MYIKLATSPFVNDSIRIVSREPHIRLINKDIIANLKVGVRLHTAQIIRIQIIIEQHIILKIIIANEVLWIYCVFQHNFMVSVWIPGQPHFRKTRN